MALRRILISYANESQMFARSMSQYASEGPLMAKRFVDREQLENPNKGMLLILEEPVEVVDGRVARTGGDATGHPVNFLNLDNNKVVMCPYSGQFFVKKQAVKSLLSSGELVEKDGKYYKNIISDNE